MKRRTAAAAVLASSLAACAVGPDYSAPETRVPGALGAAAKDGVKAGPPVAAWWTTFKDPVLDGLVGRAVRGNLDLRAAQARVREARARSTAAGAERYPTVNATGDASRIRTSDNIGDVPGGTANLFRAGFDAVWELDIFGGVRRGVEATEAEEQATIEDRRDVLVSLLAELAFDYTQMRGAQRRASISRANLTAQRQTLELTKSRLAAGVATELDVSRAQAQVESTAADVPQYESSARRFMLAIAVLLGEQPTALIPELSKEAPFPAIPAEVPVGLPSELLLRRPDVRRAERLLASATARIGEAEADLYPRFSLSAAFGYAAATGGDLVDAASRAGSVGGAVSWPVLDFGRVRSGVDFADAREEQALAAYEAAVLRSLRDVEDALVGLSAERERRVSLDAACVASRRAVELANQLWTAGRTDFLGVLDAERDLYAAEDALVESDRRAAAELVSLYKALGGGWEIESEIEESRPQGEPGRRVVDVVGTEERRAE
jgi:NodT family efflux transporter outer membrane factor (OMF) lipoprotein